MMCTVVSPKVRKGNRFMKSINSCAGSCQKTIRAPSSTQSLASASSSCFVSKTRNSAAGRRGRTTERRVCRATSSWHVLFEVLQMLLVFGHNGQHALATAKARLRFACRKRPQCCHRLVVLGDHYFLTRAELADDVR